MPKAVVLTKYGPPDVLVWSDVPMPEPGPGQVRIRIKAAGVSPTDPKIRRGDLKAVFPLPARAVLGFEAAGVVDALGPSVSGAAKGTRSPVSWPVSAATASTPSPRRGHPSHRMSAGAMPPPSPHRRKPQWAS